MMSPTNIGIDPKEMNSKKNVKKLNNKIILNFKNSSFFNTFEIILTI